MNAQLRAELVPPALRQAVPDEFAEGRPCDKWSHEIYKARSRLADRLGTDEDDSDILAIVNAYEHMSQYIAEKMYVYGKMDLEKIFPENFHSA